MGAISARAAIGAGFRLIAREPLAFLAWCAAYFFVGVLPQLVMADTLIPFVAAFSAAGGDPNNAALIAAEQRMSRYTALSYLSSFVTVTLIPGAVFRAVLMPDDRRFLYLRIGAREGWLGLSVVTIIAAMIIASVALSLPVALLAAVGGGAAGGAIGAFAVAAALAALLWALLRLSFAPVMSFSDQKFRLTESWAATRGQSARLLAVALALFVLVMAAYVIVISAASAAFTLDPAAPALARAWQTDPRAAVARLGPGWIVGGLAAVTVFSTWANVMGAAAWASMRRDLKG